jgi:hypothetical protein
MIYAQTFMLLQVSRMRYFRFLFNYGPAILNITGTDVNRNGPVSGLAHGWGGDHSGPWGSSASATEIMFGNAITG